MTDLAGLDAELQRTIDAFADHDWGEHSPVAWILAHALNVGSGAQAIAELKRDALPDE